MLVGRENFKGGAHPTIADLGHCLGLDVATDRLGVGGMRSHFRDSASFATPIIDESIVSDGENPRAELVVGAREAGNRFRQLEQDVGRQRLGVGSALDAEIADDRGVKIIIDLAPRPVGTGLCGRQDRIELSLHFAFERRSGHVLPGSSCCVTSVWRNARRGPSLR